MPAKNTFSADTIYEQDLILTQGSALTLSDGTNVRIVSKAFSYVTNEPVSLLDGSFLTLSDGTALEAGITRYQTKRVNSIYFTTPISLDAAVIPHRGDVLSYGYELDTVSREFTITAIKPNGSEGYSLELYDYNEAIFDYDSVEIPDYEVTITERRAIEGVKPSEVPEVYPTYEATNSIAESIARTVSEEVATEVVADKTPRYLGILTSLPASANEGDWFTANGFSGFTTGKVYKYTKVTGGYEWQLLTENSASYMEMMAALPDIMSVMSSSTSDGYFSTVFAKLLVAGKAFIENLSASVIELHKDSGGNGGVIQSSNYNGTINASGEITAYGDTGWAIDYNGKADFANMNATSANFDFVKISNSFFKLENSFFAIRNDTEWTSTPLSFFSKFYEKYKNLFPSTDSYFNLLCYFSISFSYKDSSDEYYTLSATSPFCKILHSFSGGFYRLEIPYLLFSYHKTGDSTTYTGMGALTIGASASSGWVKLGNTVHEIDSRYQVT